MNERITEFKIEVPCSEEQAKIFVNILKNHGGDFDAMKEEFPDASDGDVETVSYRPSFDYEATENGLSVWSEDKDGDFEMAVTLIHLWMQRENIPGAVPAAMHYHGDECGDQACVVSKGGIVWCDRQSAEEQASALAEKIAAEQSGTAPR